MPLENRNKVMFILLIISLMLAGVAIGYMVRRRNTSIIHRLITGLIWVLLFLLGTEVGSNQTIIEGLHTIGLEALLLTIAGVIGSSLASWGLWVYICRGNQKKGIKP